jgi:putative methylase
MVQIRKRRLEIALQKLKPLSSRSATLEQYATPADIATDVLWEAYAAGDIMGRSVMDLGCGNGIFAIGARLLGAESVSGIDIDPRAVKIAQENADSLSLEIEFKTERIEDVKAKTDTVLQNPPFGAQTSHADRGFVKKALQIAPRVYSIHNDGSEQFMEKLARSLGGRCDAVKKYKFEIPYAFEFHKKATETISVVLLRFER